MAQTPDLADIHLPLHDVEIERIRQFIDVQCESEESQYDYKEPSTPPPATGNTSDVSLSPDHDLVRVPIRQSVLKKVHQEIARNMRSPPGMISCGPIGDDLVPAPLTFNSSTLTRDSSLGKVLY